MKKTIVYSSATGNTEKLAKTIFETLGEDVYCGKINDNALDADIIFIGSWAMAFTCTADIKNFAEKLNNKKVFLFMTAGYNNSDEYLNNIMSSFKGNLNNTNEIIGEFICQGKVSESKIEALKQIGKYESFEAGIKESQNCVKEADLLKLKNLIKGLGV